MKPILKTLVVTLALSGPAAVGGTSLAAAEPEQGASGNSTSMMPMQQHMERMQDQMMRMHEAADPEKRRALMQDHMQSMQGMMKMMHGMMAGQEMMGGHHPGGTSQEDATHGSAPPKGMSGGMGDMMPRMNMMEQRMNMMQMMMDQMLQNQEILMKEGQPDKE